MKIVAVRGENLASLRHFEVDLEADLGGAGLFAITGPTGSGKSTLLDAICLALFDRTPRLGGKRSDYEVGATDGPEALRTGVNDVRGLLTRGAAAGSAEVDFVGVDGRCYRACWQVRRARGKHAGRLQAQSMTLTGIDHELRIAGPKREVLGAIEQRLGLSFEQFCRSVLLAQGDFAAFLHADESQRAALLERITGTEIYGALSLAAHERARTLREQLASAEAAVAASPPLPTDARAELEAEATAAKGRLAAIEGRHRLLAELQRAMVQGGEIASELDAAGRLSAEHRATCKKAEARLHEAETERRRAAAAGVLAAEDERDTMGEQLAATDRAIDRADRWLADHQQHEQLVAGWSGWRAALGQIAAARRQITVGERQSATLEIELAARVERCDGATAEVQRAAEAVGMAEKHEQDAANAFDAKRFEALDDAAGEQRKRLEQLDLLEQALERRRAVEAALQEIARGAGEMRTASGQLEERERDLLERAARCDGALEQARGALEHTRAALSLRERREELVDGEPCPLCGATSHPYTGDGELPKRANEERQDVAALERRQAALAAEQTDLSAERIKLETRSEAMQRHQDEREREREQAEQALVAAAARCGIDAVSRAATAERIAATRQRARDLLDGHAAEREALHQAGGALEAARGKSRQARTALEGVRQAAALAADEMRGTKTALDESRAATRRCEADIEQARARLEQPLCFLSEWWTALEEDEQAFERDRAAEVAAFEERRAERERLRTRLAEQQASAREIGRRLEQVRRRCLTEIDAPALPDELRRKARAWLVQVLASAPRPQRGERLARLVAEAVRGREQAAQSLADARAARAAAEGRCQELVASRDKLATRRMELRARLELDDDAAVDQPLGACAAELAEATGASDELRVALKQDDERRVVLEQGAERLAALEAQARPWLQLAEVIGSHDGKKLRVFAQSLTLGQVVAQANAHLRELAPRYRLDRVPHVSLALQVVDRDMGDEVRAVGSLSGGETFLVSLALALGLASLSSRRVRVESMFIDEGFGSLDATALDLALSTLDGLQASGRQIGIISHVPRVAERFGACLRVEPLGAGRSRLRLG